MKWLAALALALLPSVAQGAIAFDSSNLGATGTGNLSWDHTPTGTAAGVLVLCGHVGSTDEITSVTAEGVAMSEVTGSPLAKATGETGVVYGYFLGSGIVTGGGGEITIAVTVSGGTSKRCSSFIVTATGDTSIEGTDTISNDSLDDPQDTITTTVETWVGEVLMSGHDSTSGVGGMTGYTNVLQSDLGTQVLVMARITSNDAGSNVAWGFVTPGAEDVVALGVALREAPASSGAGCIIGGGMACDGNIQ